MGLEVACMCTVVVALLAFSWVQGQQIITAAPVPETIQQDPRGNPPPGLITGGELRIQDGLQDHYFGGVSYGRGYNRYSWYDQYGYLPTWLYAVLRALFDTTTTTSPGATSTTTAPTTTTTTTTTTPNVGQTIILTCASANTSCVNCYGWSAGMNVVTTAGNAVTLTRDICCPTCAAASTTSRPSGMQFGRGTNIQYTDDEECSIDCLDEAP